MIRRGLTWLAAIALLGACAPSSPSIATRHVDTGVDPSSWVTVPAGEFLWGQFDEEAEVDHDFDIMVTHVTNTQYAEYLTAQLAAGTIRIDGGHVVGHYPGDVFHGARHEKEIPEGDYPHVALRADGSRIVVAPDGGTTIVDGYVNHPVTMVTWFGARAYCESVGGRLPTEKEWEKAARGTEDNRPFPWGDELEKNRANYYSSTDIFEKVAGRRGDTTPVGFYNGNTYEGFATLSNASPFGAYDMVGNVWQWMGDVREGTHDRYLRGGSMRDHAYVLRIWSRNSARPDYEGPSIGFRCVRDSEAATP